MSLRTVTFSSYDNNDAPVAGDVFVFKLLQYGTATDAPIHLRREVKADPTAADGTGSIPLWVNDESEKSSIYRVTFPSGESGEFVIPAGVGEIDLSDLLINYNADAVDPQANIQLDSKANLNASNVDPGAATSWRSAINVENGATADQTGAEIKSLYEAEANTNAFTDADATKLDGIEAGAEVNDPTGLSSGDIGSTVQAWDAQLDDIAALTPSDEAVMRGDGTNWVVATNFRVDAGTTNSGTEMGTGTADGVYAVAEGQSTTASGSASHAEGQSTTASGSASHAEGQSTTASGSASHAEGESTTASGDYSSATGRRGKAIHDGARVEADSQNADVSSTTTDQFTARFQNGYVLQGGALTLGTDLAITEGGTGASTASAARTNLGLGAANDVVFNRLAMNRPAASASGSEHIDFTGNITGFRGIGADVEDFGYYRSNVLQWHANSSGMIISRPLTLGTDLAVTEGGTGASTVGAAKQNLQVPTRTVTATTDTALVTDSTILVDDDTAAATVTITLPAAATAGDGFELIIFKKGSTADVIIEGDGSETINGELNVTLISEYESIKIITDGTEWFII